MTGQATGDRPRPLEGRRALVTGGSRGIGRAIVRRLAADGASVVFSFARNQDQAGQLIAGLTADGGRISSVQADVSDLEQVTRMFDVAAETLGGLDILVNNAGETFVSPISKVAEKDYDRVMAINAKAVFFSIQRAATLLNTGGRIITLSSMNTIRNSSGISVYAASKAAVEQFTQVAAYELGRRKITVNAVCPGPVDTDMLRSAQPREALELAAVMTPLRRLGLPADIAAVVAFLAGPDSGWITGQCIRANGGMN